MEADTKRHLAAGPILALLLSSAPRAEEAPRLLAWEDCVALALRGNPDLGAALRAEAAGRASARGSVNGLLPQVSLSNGYSDGSAADGGRWQAQASVSQVLWDASRAAEVRSASAGYRQATAARRQASADARFDLRQAFAQLLFQQRNVEVSRTILEMRRRSAELVSLRYGSGVESKGNRLRSRAQALQAEADLAQARRVLRTARQALDRRLGLDDFEVVSATGTLTAAPAPGLPEDVRPLVAARPDVALQEFSVEAAQAGLSRARSDLWPSISGNYARTRSGGSEFPSENSGWTASAVLNYPLFAGGPTAAYYASAAAREGLEKAKEDLRAAREQARVDVETSWAGYAGAADQVGVQAALLEAARQRNDEADVRYASGLMTYDNWEIIASDRIGAERQSLQSQLNAVVSEAAWERALGKPLGDQP